MYTCDVFLVATVVIANVVVGSQANYDCHDVSNDVDKWLVESGEDMRRAGADSVSVGGFKRVIPVSIFGFDIPYLKVYLQVSEGSLQSLDKLTRASSSENCRSSPTRNVTSGDFQYKDASITFNSMKANFLFWQTEGKFTYKFLPKLRMVFESNSNSTCVLADPVILESSGDSDYVINTGYSLQGWILGKILHGALLGGGDNTPMLMDFIQLASQAIESYFSNYCCKGSKGSTRTRIDITLDSVRRLEKRTERANLRN